MQLAILAFSIVFLSSLVNWLGKSVLTTAAYEVYSLLMLGSIRAQQRSLKQEILKNRNLLQATSSQDQFAKWAKLRRKVDKGLVDLEQINSSITSGRTRFTTVLDTILSVFTAGAQWAAVWWFRRNAVFWMPAGWMPGSIEWIMSLGGGPRGSVSVTVWLVMCRRVVSLFNKAGIASFWELFHDPTPVLIPVQAGGSQNLR